MQLGDTDKVPYTSLSAGSKAAYSAGTAARKAAEGARERLLQEAAAILDAAPADLAPLRALYAMGSETKCRRT